MASVRIKTYSDPYRKSVQTLILSIQTTEFSIPITLEQQPDLHDITGFYQKGIGNFWIATVDDEVVGTIALIDIGNHQGALRKMFVSKEFRGKEFGVGQLLLDTLLRWAKEKNVKEILLGTTEKFVAAQRFYEKNGFIEIPKASLPTSFPVMSVDVKFYRYTLD